ncbi:MAG: PIG-L family deacetylase [Firmicutes bacterium]|nr:PIG-L family deacetylase [Bacillota bacterium]
MENVLVFAPHPDDDIIGCGGSVAHHINRGDQVAVVYMTSGEAGSLKYEPAKLVSVREMEAQNAAAVLGVFDLTYLRYPDGYLEYNQSYLDAVVTLIREKKPTWVYIPHQLDAIPDHQITHRIVREACRRAAGPWYPQCGREPWQVNTILGYEVWTPLTEVGFSLDISAFIALKLEALRLHRSQTESISYDQAVQGLNRYRGVMTGRGDYCECFQVLQAQI